MVPLSPTFIGFVLFTSRVSPIPTRNVPFLTCTVSSVGWKWGEILYPVGIESWMTNSPALPGSPLTTAIRAPLGNTAGAGPHLSGADFVTFDLAADGAWADRREALARSSATTETVRRIRPP